MERFNLCIQFLKVISYHGYSNCTTFCLVICHEFALLPEVSVRLQEEQFWLRAMWRQFSQIHLVTSVKHLNFNKRHEIHWTFFYPYLNVFTT